MEVFTVFCVLVFILLIALWIYGIKDYNYWDKCGVFNKKPFLPFLGNLRVNQFFKSNLQMVQDLYESMPGRPYGGIYFLTTPALVVRDPEIIKSILVTDFNHFVNRGFNCNPDCDPVANNIIHLTGKNWKYAKSKLQACFGPNRMKLLIPEIDKLAMEVLEQIQNSNNGLQKYITFDITDLIDRYMIDVITFSSYGIKSNTIRDREKSELYNIAGDAFGGHHFMFHMFVGFLFPKFHKLIDMTTTPKHVIKFFLGLTKKIMTLRKDNAVETDRKIFFDAVVKMANNWDQESRTNECQPVKDDSEAMGNPNQLEETGVFDENFVVANTFIIFAAGYDASSKISSFSLFEMAYNEDIQNKAREEILRVLTESDGKITLEAVQKMTYLDQIIAETNRKYPMLSILFRKCVKRYELPDGGIIEPDIPIMIPSSAIHFDPVYFPNPHKYDPERFNESNKMNIHPATHIPFGMGPRMCLAYQFAVAAIKTILARILSKYRITLHNSCKEYPLKLQPKSFLLTPEKHIILNATEIEFGET